MRIAYVTTDEVNHDLAERTASKCGAAVRKLLPNGPAPDGVYDAVLYNLDDMPRDEQLTLLEKLHQATPQRPTAVHGYDISEEQIRALGHHGVAAARRFHRDLLRDLIAAAQRLSAAIAADDTATDLTWVNLAQ
jgi:hypothetical protein